MTKKRPRTEQNLARNLRYLMDRHGWKEAETAKRAGVSQKTINNALNQVYRLKTDTADQIASAFKLGGWDIIKPDLVEDIESGRFEVYKELAANFAATDDEGRKFIAGIAQREADRKRGTG